MRSTVRPTTGATATGIANCVGNEIAVGGGGSDSAVARASIKETVPVLSVDGKTATGWKVVTAGGANSSAGSVTVYVFCAPLS